MKEKVYHFGAHICVHDNANLIYYICQLLNIYIYIYANFDNKKDILQIMADNK